MLAELVRIYHVVTPGEAHAIIADLVTRDIPVIEEIDGQPVCSKELGVSDRIVIFLSSERAETTVWRSRNSRGRCVAPTAATSQGCQEARRQRVGTASSTHEANAHHSEWTEGR